MGSYYYLMAQLPFLIYDQKPPMSSENFKALAESLMSREDSAFLGKISLDPNPDDKDIPAYAQQTPSTGCPFIDGWNEWERSLRLNTAKFRAAHLKREASSLLEPPFTPADAALAAAKAVNSDCSPLEGEFIIDKARWNAIENLAGYDVFSKNQVYAYYLKLLLLERREAFNVDRGFAEYKSLYSQIIEKNTEHAGEPI